MATKSYLTFGVLVFTLIAAGCGGNKTPTTPAVTTLDVSGTWSGTYSSSQLGFGTAILALSQSGQSVAGTWSSRPSPGGGSDLGGGTVSGMNPLTGNSGTFTITLGPSNPTNCPFQATVTVFLAQRQMTGQWAAMNCTVTATGGLILSKI